VVSIAVYDGGMYGYTSGYYVVFENKSVSKMNCIPWTEQKYSNMYNYTCAME